MKYPCGIIRDLLPVYCDEVCTDESKSAVENHLAECENCREYYNTVKSEDNFSKFEKVSDEEQSLTKSLKSVKRRLNKKNKIIITCSIAAIVICFFAFEILLNFPVKNVSLDDVSVSVDVYPMNELITNKSGDESAEVRISSDKNDDSSVFTITVPELSDSEINVTQDVVDKNNYISVVSWSSPCFLREIKYDDKNKNDSVIYVKAFKTTVLNNKAQPYNQKIVSMEMKKIDKIVYVEDDETQITLWENK